ncbi:hypothetical protein [Mesorhizobium silamurunense]|uniref:hypothetical protein n=1 Tax=Mesorhizobium silamurunense TaxID=499528 RepID=UPI00177DD82A|nr:hypothetical protein [Mesorhizobium silamurunense]
MALNGSADSEQLSLLTNVIDDYCCQAGIAVGHPARGRLGRRIVELFQGGIHNPDELLSALNSGYDEWLGEVGRPSSSSEYAASLASGSAPPEPCSLTPVEARGGGASRFPQADVVDRSTTSPPRPLNELPPRKGVSGSVRRKSSETARPSRKASETRLRDGEAGIIENNEM